VQLLIEYPAQRLASVPWARLLPAAKRCAAVVQRT
jgi:hypothetical protein